jgi:hypothetical protein
MEDQGAMRISIALHAEAFPFATVAPLAACVLRFRRGRCLVLATSLRKHRKKQV